MWPRSQHQVVLTVYLRVSSWDPKLKYWYAYFNMTLWQRRQSALKSGGRGSGFKIFRFFQGDFKKIDFFMQFSQNISYFQAKISLKICDFPGENFRMTFCSHSHQNFEKI